MSRRCLNERTTALVDAASKERHRNLLHTIQQVRSDMNSRGMLPSSEHVNKVCDACASELREMGKVIWESIKRAHESCGSNTSEDLPALFRTLLQNEKTKLEQTQEGAVGGVARQLLNQALLQFQLVSEAHDNILAQYDLEIAIYLDNLKRGSGKNYFERLKCSFLNNKLIAAGAVIVVVIVGLASFTDALGRLSSFISGAVGSSRQANPTLQRDAPEAARP